MRVVSLCPSTTKLIFDLGAGADVVGITKYCVHPVDAVKSLPKVGGTKDPDLAAIRALEPDLVLMNREENRREDYDTLVRWGLCCHASFPVTLDETERAILDVGEALGRREEAQTLVGRIQGLRAEAAKGRRTRQSLRWAYLIWRKPYMAVGSGCYIHELISEAGGRNVFADGDGAYLEISADMLAEAKPQLVMLSSEPFPFKAKHIDELADRTGLSPGCFRLVDGERLSWHGAFTCAGLRYAMALMDD